MALHGSQQAFDDGHVDIAVEHQIAQVAGTESGFDQHAFADLSTTEASEFRDKVTHWPIGFADVGADKSAVRPGFPSTLRSSSPQTTSVKFGCLRRRPFAT